MTFRSGYLNISKKFLSRYLHVYITIDKSILTCMGEQPWLNWRKKNIIWSLKIIAELVKQNIEMFRNNDTTTK